MSIRNIGKGLGRWGAVCGVLWAGLGLSVAAPATTQVAVPATTPVGGPALANGSGPEVEVLHVGGTLTIALMDTPTPILTFEGKIKEDGTITLTLNQTFKADGKTPGDLEKEIRERYVPKFFKYMTVTVKQEQNSLWYYVDGEVKTPSRQL